MLRYVPSLNKIHVHTTVLVWCSQSVTAGCTEPQKAYFYLLNMLRVDNKHEQGQTLRQRLTKMFTGRRTSSIFTPELLWNPAKNSWKVLKDFWLLRPSPRYDLNFDIFFLTVQLNAFFQLI